MAAPLIVIVGGVLLLAYFVYDFMQYRMRRRLRQGAGEGRISRRISYDWRTYVMILFTVLLAFLFARPITRTIAPDIEGVPPETITGHAYLVAFFVLIVGLWWSIRQARKVRISERMLINEQVGEIVHSFRSVFRIRPTVFSALEDANRKMPPPVGTAVAHAVTTFYVTSLPRRALDELRSRITNPYMDQFIYILERGEDAKHEDILGALEDLIVRLRRAREMRDQSEVNMTVITGQTRIIQLIAVALVTVVAVVPRLRWAYETLPGQLLFIVIASVGVLTSWYIDRRSTELKERVL
jgi:hypothetical protein